jgi:hypothetical protein
MYVSRLNKEWHQEHRMPPNASKAQKLRWHLEHVKHCACRPLPLGVAEELARRGMSLPGRTRMKLPQGLTARRKFADHGNGALIAPCGMYCGICSGYLAYRHHVPRIKGKIAYCSGCRQRNKQCAHLKGECFLLRSNRVKYCFECPSFPCDRLKRTDERYRRDFSASPIENLKEIKEHGEIVFLENQETRFGCHRCGTLKSVHSGKCYVCDEINSWKD